MKEVIAELRQLETKIIMAQNRISKEIKILYWVVGITMAGILFV